MGWGSVVHCIMQKHPTSITQAKCYEHKYEVDNGGSY